MRAWRQTVTAGAVACASFAAIAQAPAGGQAAPAGQAQGAAPQGRGAAGRGAPAQNPTTFFVASVGKGDGANYGGLAGADAYCSQLAQAANLPAQPGRTWRAYLSAGAANGQPSVNARDRIGAGPWHNARGALIAANVADLHGDIQRDRNAINKQQALSEKGQPIPGAGDTPNQHDILTGSDSHGRAIAGEMDTTCGNYTRNTDGSGSVMVGHHDRTGGANTSWNSAHGSRGCSQPNLVATGGAGLLYCFAAN